jgi:hypothetical protein
LCLADVAQHPEVLVGGRDDAPGVAHRLDDESRHRLRVLVHDNVFHRLGGETVALFPRGKPVAVVSRREDLEETGHVRLEPRLARARAAGRHGARRATVVTPVTADELVFARMACLLEVLPDELHGRFGRLGSAAEAFHVFQVSRGDGTHSLHEVERHVGNAVQRRRERHRLHLPAHRIQQARMPVPQRGDEDPADAVKIPAALGVPIIEPLRFMEDQGIANELRHLLEVDERALQQLLLTGIDFHISLRQPTLAPFRSL